MGGDSVIAQKEGGKVCGRTARMETPEYVCSVSFDGALLKEGAGPA